MEDCVVRGCARIYPRAFFFPDPAESIPPVYEAAARRGGNNTMALCRGPPPTIVPRGVPLIRSGIPLSLIRERGDPQRCVIYPPNVTGITCFELAVFFSWLGFL